MRIDIAAKPTEYLCALATLGVAIFAVDSAARIGDGPVCAFLFLLGFAGFGLGGFLLYQVLRKPARAVTPAAKPAAPAASGATAPALKRVAPPVASGPVKP